MVKSVPVVWQYVLFAFALVYAALGLGYIKDIKKIIILFYVVVFVYSLIYRQDLYRSILSFFILSAAIITVISWYFMKIDHPAIANSSPNTKPMLDKFIFVPLAIALAGDKKKIVFFLSVAAVSALLLPWTKGGGLAEFEAMLQGKRTGFGGHIITMGINYALVFMFSLVFLSSSLSGLIKEFDLKKMLRVIFLVLLAGCGVVGVLGSQTRAVYVGLIVILVLFSIKMIWKGIKEKRSSSLAFLAILIVGTSVFIQVVSDRPFFDNFIDRAERELVVVDEVLSGDLENITRNSAGLRIHFWTDAVEWIAQRPLTGWDDDANRLLHEKAGNLYKKDQYFHTIHNDYIELLLAYGVPGLLLFVVLIWWVVLRARSLVGSGVMPVAFYTCFKLFVIFFLVNGLFMSILFFPDTRFAWNIMFATIVSFILNEKFVSDRTPRRG